VKITPLKVSYVPEFWAAFGPPESPCAWIMPPRVRKERVLKTLFPWVGIRRMTFLMGTSRGTRWLVRIFYSPQPLCHGFPQMWIMLSRPRAHGV